MKVLFLLAPLLGAATFAPEPSSGPPTVVANFPDDGAAEAVIGKLKVEGTGEVTFWVHRVRNRLLLKALGPDGSQVGRAESVVGIGDTPMYVQSTRGLLKVLIHWKSEASTYELG